MKWPGHVTCMRILKVLTDRQTLESPKGTVKIILKRILEIAY